MSKYGDKIIHAEEVAEYLNRNRNFFHVFPSLLNELSIPHPKTGQSISLLERQIYQLRTQRDVLKIEVETLKDIAGENGQLLQKVYQFSFKLMAAQTPEMAIKTIYEQMKTLFEVEYINLVSWEVPTQSFAGLNQLGLSQAWSKSLKGSLQPQKPVCGWLENTWQKGLFTSDEVMESVCVLPLGEQEVWGALALGATTKRFSPELGTYFLNIMAQLITAKLGNLFPPN